MTNRDIILMGANGDAVLVNWDNITYAVEEFEANDVFKRTKLRFVHDGLTVWVKDRVHDIKAKL